MMASLTDFLGTTVLLALGGLDYNTGHRGRGLVYAGAGMTLAIGSGLAECRRVP